MNVAPAPGPVLVMGAGSVGCWVGGKLAASGLTVAFVGRPRVIDSLRQQGLTVSDLDGRLDHLDAARFELHTQVPAASPALVLLCVKSGDTVQAALELAAALPKGTLVLSLQNGVSNAITAARQAREFDIVPAVVPFNVAEIAPGHVHRGTSGVLAARDRPRLRAWLPAFAAAGVPLQLHGDLRALQWGKLLLNLNNPVNALSGLPLREQLADRDFRRATAALQQEALAVLHAAQIVPARLTPLPWARVTQLMRLPTPLFKLLAARMLRIDAKARSSMADDLARDRPTEIDALCGEVVRLAARHGGGAPLNARMMQLVAAWPSDPRPRSGLELLRSLGLR